MYNFKFGDPFSVTMNVTNAYTITISPLKEAQVLQDNLRSTFDELTLNSTVYIAHTVSVLGTSVCCDVCKSTYSKVL